MSAREFMQFWGKAQPDSLVGPRWHPLAHHLLDVAAVMDSMLTARPLVLRRVAERLGLGSPDAQRLLVALAALHDLGKFAPAFQAKAPEHWPPALGRLRPSAAVKRLHTQDGIILWDQVLGDHLVPLLWPAGAEVVADLVPGVFGHHGRPVSAGYFADNAKALFTDAGLSMAVDCALCVLRCVMPTPIDTTPHLPNGPLASWYVAGLSSIADWVGSRGEWFAYVAPIDGDDDLAQYWCIAKVKAAIAVRFAGLVPGRSAASRTFTSISGLTSPPTPLQLWSCDVALPDGPSLFLMEDQTGSGKTEAAQMLVHRLMAAGRATGAYWAMPTMATANAMYERQHRAIAALYDSSATKPSLILAHSQRSLYGTFQPTVLGGVDLDRAASPQVENDDAESSVACAAFLADDRRAALLADVGAGTIDQALLGTLASRFNAIRLFGLSEKVLVVDEAHAYDAYVHTELLELLRFQAALGGSAIMLSATLAQRQREMIAQAWMQGVSGGGRRPLNAQPTASAYPLATVVGANELLEAPVESASWSRRAITVRLVHTVFDAARHVLDAAALGARVAWIRNTVRDCLDGAAILRAEGCVPLVFHARFAQGDRQQRELEVMKLFGKEASESGSGPRVVVATQVMEQSLDLDFDAMVSDVAPADLLVQRAGRLWRHRRRTERELRPRGLGEELVVLSPAPIDQPPGDWLAGPFSGTAKVYRNAAVLWRTVRALARDQAIRMPEGLRDLIEAAYHEDDESLPESLLHSVHRAQGEENAAAAAATYAVLKPPDGYRADAVPWTNDLRTPTRPGEEYTVIRLARVAGDRRLEPWCPSPDDVPWKSWALSEVRVGPWFVPPSASSTPTYGVAVAAIREMWGRWEQDIPVLALTSDGGGDWSGDLLGPGGRIIELTYSTHHGLDKRNRPHP